MKPFPTSIFSFNPHKTHAGLESAPATQGTESQHLNFKHGITTPLSQGRCEDQMKNLYRNVLAKWSGSTQTNSIFTAMIIIVSHTSPENQTALPCSSRWEDQELTSRSWLSCWWAYKGSWQQKQQRHFLTSPRNLLKRELFVCGHTVSCHPGSTTGGRSTRCWVTGKSGHKQWFPNRERPQSNERHPDVLHCKNVVC